MIVEPSARPTLSECLMTLKEVAALARVSPGTVKKWAKAGRVPYTLTPGGQYRIAQAHAEALLNADAP